MEKILPISLKPTFTPNTLGGLNTSGIKLGEKKNKKTFILTRSFAAPFRLKKGDYQDVGNAAKTFKSPNM